jgi:uncharacterized hydrophobic protein (TIGR00271 family)
MEDEKPTPEQQPESESGTKKENPQGKIDLGVDIDFDPARLKAAWRRLLAYLKTVVNIREGVDIPATIQGIKSSIDFNGYNIWILVCSMAIASIGLNSNSPAVIIGAMLISPLMGPIRGIGLAAGVNDLPLLFSSLRNFGIMVGVSLATAFFFFWLNPLKAETPEILARTKPQILDVMVAFLGGIAGIVAASRKDIGTVVPGVAIATALMPPLCTAGYGLATANMGYFFGAMYLFLLNALFICLSTIVIVKYLRFPLASYLNERTQKRVKLYILGFLLLILIPAGFKFAEVVRESVFMARGQEFVDEVISPYEDAHLNDVKYYYDGSESVIEVSFIGKNIPDEVQREWRRRLPDFNLDDITLKVFQNESAEGGVSAEYLMEAQKLHKLDVEELSTRLSDAESELKVTRKKLKTLERYQADVRKLDKKIAFSFPDLKEYFYAPAIQSNLGGRRDTIITLLVRWSEDVEGHEDMLNRRLEEWLELELETKRIKVIPYSNEIRIGQK